LHFTYRGIFFFDYTLHFAVRVKQAQLCDSGNVFMFRTKPLLFLPLAILLASAPSSRADILTITNALSSFGTWELMETNGAVDSVTNLGSPGGRP
jgi:hypothetical protein